MQLHSIGPVAAFSSWSPIVRLEAEFESGQCDVRRIDTEWELIEREIARTPVLTAEEEADLLARKHEPGAREHLVRANLRLVVKALRRYTFLRSLTTADLLHDGVLGLMRAIDEHDPQARIAFSTCATVWIRAYMGRARLRTDAPIRVPVGRDEINTRSLDVPLDDGWTLGHTLERDDAPPLDDSPRAGPCPAGHTPPQRT